MLRLERRERRILERPQALVRERACGCHNAGARAQRGKRHRTGHPHSGCMFAFFAIAARRSRSALMNFSNSGSVYGAGSMPLGTMVSANSLLFTVASNSAFTRSMIAFG